MEQIKKGDQFMCVITVVMDGHRIYTAFTKGLIYKSDYNGSLINNEGKNHGVSNEFIDKHFKLHTEPEPCNLKLPDYYNNEHGSLYLIAQQRGWNAWQQDIIKRVTRCENKGEFFSDLNKTKALIDLYIKEQGDKFKGDK